MESCYFVLNDETEIFFLYERQSLVCVCVFIFCYFVKIELPAMIHLKPCNYLVNQSTARVTANDCHPKKI